MENMKAYHFAYVNMKRLEHTRLQCPHILKRAAFLFAFALLGSYMTACQSNNAQNTSASTTQKITVSLKTEEYDYGVDDARVFHKQFQYNDDGLLTKQIFLDEQTISSWEDFTYDTDGSLMTVTGFYGDDQIEYELRYEKDPANAGIVKRDKYQNNALWYTYVTKRDQNGKLLMEQYLNSNGELIQNQQYTYDSQGNMIRSAYLDSNGESQSWTDHIYDKQKHETECISYYDTGVIADRRLFLYENDKLSRETRFDAEGTPWMEILYCYDDHGSIISKEYTMQKQTYKYEYLYDAEGFMLQQKEFYNGELNRSIIYQKKEVLPDFADQLQKIEEEEAQMAQDEKYVISLG